MEILIFLFLSIPIGFSLLIFTVLVTSKVTADPSNLKDREGRKFLFNIASILLFIGLMIFFSFKSLFLLFH